MQAALQLIRMVFVFGVLLCSGGSAWAAEAKLDYNRLEKECENKDSPNCCKAAVKTMRAHGYFLKPAEGCPSGYRMEMLRCHSTPQWCEPVDTKGKQKVEH
jgi:hypothetical protein